MDREWLQITVRIPENIVQQAMTIFDAEVAQAKIESGRVIKRRTILELQNRQHVAERDLINSLSVEIDKANPLNGLVSLTTVDIAANALEYGTEPTADEGPVNVSNIVVWLEEKGIEPDYGTIEDYAYVIARKIGQLGMTVNGIPVKGNLKRPFNAAQKKAKTEIESLWQQMLSDFAGEFNRRA